MPVIKVIAAISVYIYFFDHNPPHFHAKYAEFEELILIETLETYTGYLPTKQRKMLMKWARSNQEYLRSKWKEYNPT